LLCVEDDEDDCSWIKVAAGEIDAELAFVNKPDGREALQFLEQQKEQGALPCLIILDMNMPVMDGKQTLVVIKADAVLQKIPIIVFTTSSNPKDRLFCELYGVELVTKPDRVQDFKKIVHHLVLSRCA
jgi:CheY-like chemotaxis protein